MTFLKLLTKVILLLCAILDVSRGTGSLYDPPSRPVMWKYGYPTEKNYDYMLLNCGGEKQPEDGPTQCGVCGDYVNGTRDHELGGTYGTGIIGRYYPPGIKEFHVKVELNSFEGGFFEFRLCPANDKPVTQTCLDEYLLPIQQGYVNGTPFRYFPNNAGDFRLTIALPPKMTCDRCVLQWRYHTGNSWGTDPDTGLSGTGLGLQKDFYNCADIRIGGTIPDSVLANPFFAPADNRLQNGRIKTAEFIADSVSVDPVKPTIVDHVSPSVLGALQDLETRENMTANNTFGTLGIDMNIERVFGVQREPKTATETASGFNIVISGDAGTNLPIDLTNELVTGNQSDAEFVVTNFGFQTNSSDQSMAMLPGVSVVGNSANTRDVAGINNAAQDNGFVSNTNIPIVTKSNEANTVVSNVNHEKVARLMIDVGNKNTVNNLSPGEASNIENTLDLTNSFNLPSQNIPSTKTSSFSEMTISGISQSSNTQLTPLVSGLPSGSVQDLDVPVADSTPDVGLTKDSNQLLDVPIGDTSGSTQIVNNPVEGITSRSEFTSGGFTEPPSEPVVGVTTRDGFKSGSINLEQEIVRDAKTRDGFTSSSIQLVNEPVGDATSNSRFLIGSKKLINEPVGEAISNVDFTSGSNQQPFKPVASATSSSGFTIGSTEQIYEPTRGITSSGGFTSGYTERLNAPVEGMTADGGFSGMINTASSPDVSKQFTSGSFVNENPTQPSVVSTNTKEQPAVPLSTILSGGARETMSSSVSNIKESGVPGVVISDGNNLTPEILLSSTSPGQGVGHAFSNQADKSVTGAFVDTFGVTSKDLTPKGDSSFNLAQTDTIVVDNVTRSILNIQGGQTIVEPYLEVKPTESSFELNVDTPVRNLDTGFGDKTLALPAETKTNNQGDIVILYNKTTTRVQGLIEKEQLGGLSIDLPQNTFSASQNPISMSEVPIVTSSVIINQRVPDPTIDYSTLSDPLINSESTVNLAPINTITTDSRPLSFDPFDQNQNNNRTLSVNDKAVFDITQPNELRLTDPSMIKVEENINLAPIIRNDKGADTISTFENKLVENVPRTDSTMKTYPNIPLSLDSLGVTDTSQIIPDIIIDSTRVRTDGTTDLNSLGIIRGPNAENTVVSGTDMPILDKPSMSSVGVILDAAEPNSESKLATVTKTKDIVDGTSVVLKPESVQETNVIDKIKTKVDGLLDSRASGTLILENPTIPSDVTTDLKDPSKVSIDIKLPPVDLKLPPIRQPTTNPNDAAGGTVASGVPDSAARDYKVTGGTDGSATDIMTFMKDVQATKELMNRKYFSKTGPDGTMSSIGRESSTDIQKELNNFNLTDIPNEKVIESNVQVGTDGILRPSFGQRQDENTRFRNLNRSPDTTSIKTSEAERRVLSSTGRSSGSRSDRRERVQIDPRTGMQIRVRNFPSNGQMAGRNPGMVFSGRELRMGRGDRGMIDRRRGVSRSRASSSSVTRSNGVGRTSVGFRSGSQGTMPSRDRMMSNQASRRTDVIRQPQGLAGRRPTPPGPSGQTFGPVGGFRTGDFGPPGFPPIVSGGRFFPPSAFDTGAVGGTPLLRDGSFPEFPVDARRGDFISGRGFPFVGGGTFPFGGFPVGGTSPILTPTLGSGTFDPFMGGTLTPSGFTGF